MINKKMTAVEWFDDELWELRLKLRGGEISIQLYCEEELRLIKQAKQMDNELAAQFSKEGLEKYFREAYYNAFHKGYVVGNKDAQSHPLAINIANHIHTDFEEWFENFNWQEIHNTISHIFILDERNSGNICRICGLEKWRHTEITF